MSSSDLVSVLQVQGWQRLFTPSQYPTAQHWAKCVPLLKASMIRFRLMIHALHLYVKDVGCSGLVSFYTDQKATPCWQLKSQMRKCCKSVLYRPLWTQAQNWFHENICYRLPTLNSCKAFNSVGTVCQKALGAVITNVFNIAFWHKYEYVHN